MAWEKTDDEIIAYLSEELTPSEKEAFEQRLQTDSALAAAMDRHSTFEKRLRDYGAYKQKAEEINRLNQHFSQTPGLPYRYAFLSIAILAIFIAVVFLIRRSQEYCPEELYTEAFTPRVAPDIAGQGQDAEQILRLAHSSFNQKSYAEAAEQYQQALSTGTLSPVQQEAARFFLGQSLMQERDFEAALNNFSGITQGPYLQLSEWYTALSHLALGQVEKARTGLEGISQEVAHDRQPEAEALLKKWKKLKVCG